MSIDKLLQPAITIMNKLPFKIKIIASIAILSMLFIAPSYTIFINYLDTKKIYKNQLTGLNYTKYIQDIIKTIQLHRGLSNSYLNNTKTLKKDILKSEKDLNQKLFKLIEFDKTNLNIFTYNKNFIEATNQIQLLKFNKILENSLSENMFDRYNNIISLLVNTIQDTANITSFNRSQNLKINYLADLLQIKLIMLQEYTEQLRSKATRIFTKQEVSNQNKTKLLSLYALIESHKADLIDNNIIVEMDNYQLIQKETKLVSYKLQEILEIINKHIFISKKPLYDNQDFLKKATFILSIQDKLYKTLTTDYYNIIKDMQYKMNFNMSLLLLGFLSIIFSASYVFAAFFRSVKDSLRKLQNASEMIASGNRKVHLQADTNDEIGEALLAFNKMSQKLEENISFLDSYKMAIDETNIVSKTDKKGIITYVNNKFCQISGYDRDDLIGYKHNKVRHPDMPKESFKEMWETIEDKKIWKGIVKNRKNNGGFYIVNATVIPLLDSNENIIEYIAIRHDITELEITKQEIQKQKIDLLTKLPNRNKLIDDLKIAKKPILFYLNIDNFANLNDFYGSKIGDQTLIHTANILKKVAKDADAKLYKLHADEFILYFEEAKLIEGQYKYIFKEIINHIEQQSIECNGQSCVSITISGGVVFYSEDKNKDDLINYANIARKYAKSKNKKFLLFSEEMRKDDDYANNITWINNIKEAIEQNRIVAFFQPIIDNTTGAITKYESLVRMIDKDGKAISPFFFLDIAKKAKLYKYITIIMIDKAFKLSTKRPQLDISLNIEIEDITNNDTISYIYDKLLNHPYPNHIVFEITESQEIKDYKAIQEFIKKVKNYGCKISIDDFGSGYSNFQQVLTLDVDFIKIDGSLIKNIDTDNNSRIITETIISFSKKLGCKTIVEYVHNEQVYEIVKKLGADYSQGFYLGEPKLETNDMQELINKPVTLTSP